MRNQWLGGHILCKFWGSRVGQLLFGPQSEAEGTVVRKVWREWRDCLEMIRAGDGNTV